MCSFSTPCWSATEAMHNRNHCEFLKLGVITENFIAFPAQTLIEGEPLRCRCPVEADLSKRCVLRVLEFLFPAPTAQTIPTQANGLGIYAQKLMSPEGAAKPAAID
jgi:hypothetical protein